MSARAILALAGAAALFVGHRVAAQESDEQTRDHEERDRRYYEREPANAPADREAETAAFLARADELIRDRNYRSFAGAHYRIQTDDPRVDVQAVAALLDLFRAHFEEFWSGRAALSPYERESRTFLFYSFYKFNQLLDADWRFSANRPKGHYRPWFDVITIHTDPGSSQTLGETLVHEAAHQLVEQRLLGGEALHSIWLSEGLATYFGYTYLDRERTFRPGEIGGKSVTLLKEGQPESGAAARQALSGFKQVRKALAKEGRSPYLETLALRDPAEFFGADSSRHYAASWLLVHFLLHGDDGAHAAAFVRWLAAGTGEADALLRELGLTPPELGAALDAHAGRLKVR